MENTHKIELLAPARDKICAKAAIDCGADAVYMGASDFGARKNVPNSLEDIKEVVEYAHKFNAKIYITINTILTDEEVLRARDLINELNKIGVDAIIIQDMGLVKLLNPSSGFQPASPSRGEGQIEQSSLIDEGVNWIPLHASTQCDNRTTEKVKFLQDVGFQRVVLARELSIDQIKEIKSKTNVELEAFTHGALCVSYSGQCYMSKAIGGQQGRSANRGECAQPCRKKYSLVDEDGNFIAKDKYLLNLKDFNASKHIKALVEAGVHSFKIEGRLKDENYVKNVVGYYRKLIDELAKENPLFEKTSSGTVLFDFEPNVQKSFNRGFSDYFLEKRGECFSQISPKSRGEFVGKVCKTGKYYFEITIKNGKIKLNSQDGLCYMVDDVLSGCLVNKVEGNRVFPNRMDKIKIGTEVFRNSDVEFERQLLNTTTCRKIGTDINFELGKITAVDEDKNSVEINYDFSEFANNLEKAKENIEKQLKKSGESDFLIQTVEIKTDKIPFLPLSKLNELRRELLEKLMQKRLSNYKVHRFTQSSEGKDILYPQSEIGFEGNVLNKYAKEFYESHGCKVSEMALESGLSAVGKKVMTTKHCLKYAFNMCKVNDKGKKLFLVDEKGKKYPLNFNCKNCEMEIYY